MSPRDDVSEERKNQILDAAKDTFSKVGFHKARMSDIAESSGLSKGSLYWYFDSKNDLINKLLTRVFEPEIKDLKSLVNDLRPASERLMIYAERGAEDMIKLLKWTPLVYEFFALAFRQDFIKKSIRKYYQQHMEILEELIQQGLDSGEFRANNARDAAVAIGSLLEGTAVLWIYEPDEIDIKKHIISSMELIITGLSAAQNAS